ncbi:MAG: DUF3592 domain-containing protein [Lachnospiraceae bacterium]|nr:DUF3592 domain-containing protein [Lachnospiraceae bacterium]
MKKNRFLTIFFGIFAVIGIGLLVGAVLLFVNESRFRKTAVNITGEVVDIVSHYNHGKRYHEVFVTYTFEGHTYEGVELMGYDSGMYVGKSISLLCDPENPGRVRTKSGFLLVAILLTGIGIVFSCVGIIPMIFAAKKKQKRKHLLANGRVLHATVERVGRNTSITVNGQNPYVIYCSWKDEYADVLYRFKSDNLWTDPSFLFDSGSEINVYVDGNDFSKYYVDAERGLDQKVVDFT